MSSFLGPDPNPAKEENLLVPAEYSILEYLPFPEPKDEDPLFRLFSSPLVIEALNKTYPDGLVDTRKTSYYDLNTVKMEKLSGFLMLLASTNWIEDVRSYKNSAEREMQNMQGNPALMKVIAEFKAANRGKLLGEFALIQMEAAPIAETQWDDVAVPSLSLAIVYVRYNDPKSGMATEYYSSLSDPGTIGATATRDNLRLQHSSQTALNRWDIKTGEGVIITSMRSGADNYYIDSPRKESRVLTRIPPPLNIRKQKGLETSEPKGSDREKAKPGRFTFSFISSKHPEEDRYIPQALKDFLRAHSKEQFVRKFIIWYTHLSIPVLHDKRYILT